MARVMLVGGDVWKARVREQCPQTKSLMTDFDAASMPKMDVVFFESQALAPKEKELSPPPVVVVCISVDEQVFVADFGLCLLNDDQVRSYLRSADESPPFEKDLFDRSQREFETKLFDAAGKTLVDWSQHPQRETTKQFDGRMFKEHLLGLKSAFAHRISQIVFNQPPKIVLQADFRMCLYLCEKTAYLALANSPEEEFVPRIDEEKFPHDGDAIVLADELLLLALLFLLMDMAPKPARFPLCRCRVEDQKFELVFDYRMEMLCGFKEEAAVAGVNQILKKSAAEIKLQKGSTHLNLKRQPLASQEA